MTESLWLDLRSKYDRTILQIHHQALDTIQREIEAPEIQEPQLISFIGKGVKSQLVEDLFKIKRKSGHNKIYVQLGLPMDQQRSPKPVLVADCELHNLIHPKEDYSNRAYSQFDQHILEWLVLQPPEAIAHRIYTHLIIPFSTVICLFADDFDGVGGVAKVIASWLDKYRTPSSDLCPSTFPQLLVFRRWQDAAATYDEKLATLALLRDVAMEINICQALQRRDDIGIEEVSNLVRRYFSGLSLLTLPASSGEILSLYPYLHKLKQRILQESDDVSIRRKAADVSFTALHFATFFGMACKHFASTIVDPFSFVGASRIFNPVPSDFLPSFSEFLLHVEKDFHMTFIAPVLASALCLDSLPPQMHKFTADIVFDQLYSAVLHELYQKINNPTSPDVFYKVNHIHTRARQRFCLGGRTTTTLPKHYLDLHAKIKQLFCEQYRSISHLCETSVLAHKRLLLSFSSTWERMFSLSTCLSCFMRRPEYVLSCQHSLCSTCVSIHSPSKRNSQWLFILHTCPLCTARNFIEINLKPPTAGIRCLLVDGAGTKDVEVIQEIQRVIDIPMLRIQEHFDVILGAGLGGLLVLDLFCNNSSIEECTELSSLVERYCQSPSIPRSRFSQASTIVGTKNGTWRNIVTASRLSCPQFKDNKLMVQNAAFSALKPKYSSDKTLFSCLGNERKIGIAVLRDKDNIISSYNGLPKLETAVIPFGYRSAKTLWDIARAIIASKVSYGYKSHELSSSDSMVKVLVDEQDKIWSRDKKEPDLLYCIGAEIAAYEDQPLNQGIWTYDWRFHKRQFSTADVADAALAALFYLELVCIPRITEFGYACQARVRCRLAPSVSAYLALIEKLRDNCARFYYDSKSIVCADSRVQYEAKSGIAFSRYIEFDILGLHERFDLRIGGITSKKRSISNCPYLLQTLIEDQGLDCKFGHQDHQVRRFYHPKHIQYSTWMI